MKLLVVFYSRTGNTRKIAESLAELFRCDIEEIFDMKDRRGLLGYLSAGMDAVLKKASEIKDTSNDPSQYDLVLIGTPVWAWNISAPARAYILRNKGKFGQVAFFCSKGGNEGSAFREMEALCGKKPVGVLSLNAREVSEGAHIPKVKEFVGRFASVQQLQTSQ